MKHLSIILVCLLLFSCKNKDDDTEPIDCTDIFVFGLTVQVRDITTGGIILNNISVTATDGSYVEELVFTFDTFTGAGERPGNYILTIEADGYVTRVTSEIQVDADECHVIPKFVEIQLQPL